MIEQLLPGMVRTAEAFGDRTDVKLFDAEKATIMQSAEDRQREFTTVRACAHEALGALGIAPIPLIPGKHGAPEWPVGVVGSMTHCEGYRAAAVGFCSQVDVIGIDAEPDAPLPDGVLDIISVPEEIKCLAEVAATGVAAGRLLFSAKESVYKAWFPLAHRILGFGEATVALRTDGTFTARLMTDGTVEDGRVLTGFDGRWMAASGLVLTAVSEIVY